MKNKQNIQDSHINALADARIEAKTGTPGGPAPMSNDSFVICPIATSAANRGAALIAAETEALALTPSGNALSITNPSVVIIPPGQYSVGAWVPSSPKVRLVEMIPGTVQLSGTYVQESLNRVILQRRYPDQGRSSSPRFTTYQPLGRFSNYWLATEFWASSVVPAAYVIMEQWAARWYLGKTFSQIGDYSYPDDTWASSSVSNWRYMSSDGTTRRLCAVLPANTVEVWVLGYPAVGSGTATPSLSGSGTIHLPSLNFATSGTWGSSIKYPTSFVKVASGELGGQTFTLTPNSTSSIRVAAIIALTRTPYLPGVPASYAFDPASVVEVLHSGQCSPGPINLKVGVAASKYWSEGYETGTHWTAATGWTLGNPVQTMVYGSSATAWDPSNEEWTTVATDAFLRTLTGDISVGATGTLPDVGDYTGRILLRSRSTQIETNFAWNAEAAANSVIQTGAAQGGYCGQWGLSSNFTKTGDGYPILGPWATDTRYLMGATGKIIMVGGDLTAELQAWSDDTNFPDSMIDGRADDFPKMYTYWRGLDSCGLAGESDVALDAGVVSWARQIRQIKSF